MMESKIHIKQRVQPQLSQNHRNLLFLFSCYSLFVLTSVSSAFTQPRSKCHEDERLALLEFRRSFVLDCSKTMVDEDYYDFSYPSKSKVASWNKDGFVKSNASSKDCCTWDGVRCDEITGHVIGLDLGYSCLYGYFPQNSSLFELIHLRHLNLGGNNFKHSLIPQGFGQLSNLTHLDLSLSRFSGQIPLEISRLSNLRLLDVSYSSGSTYFDDHMPLKLHNTHLETLLNNLTRLNTLALEKVNVSSTIVPITRHLSNRTSLRYLGLGSTNLFEFQPNHSSYNLRVLDLRGTRFYGKLSSSLGDQLINLHYLGLEGAGFTGEIPSSLTNISALEWLDLSRNNLYGKIPNELVQLTFLEIFNVSYNHLMGLIPYGKQFDTFDVNSFEGNPELCGNQVAKSCKDTDDGLPLPPPLPSTHDDFDRMDWIVKLLGCGSGLVVGIVGGIIFTDKHHEWLMELFGRRMRKRRVKRIRRSNH